MGLCESKGQRPGVRAAVDLDPVRLPRRQHQGGLCLGRARRYASPHLRPAPRFATDAQRAQFRARVAGSCRSARTSSQMSLLGQGGPDSAPLRRPFAARRRRPAIPPVLPQLPPYARQRLLPSLSRPLIIPVSPPVPIYTQAVPHGHTVQSMASHSSASRAALDPAPAARRSALNLEVKPSAAGRGALSVEVRPPRWLRDASTLPGYGRWGRPPPPQMHVPDPPLETLHKLSLQIRAFLQWMNAGIRYRGEGYRDDEVRIGGVCAPFWSLTRRYADRVGTPSIRLSPHLPPYREGRRSLRARGARQAQRRLDWAGTYPAGRGGRHLPFRFASATVLHAPWRRSQPPGAARPLLRCRAVQRSERPCVIPRFLPVCVG